MRTSLAQLASFLACANLALASHEHSLGPRHLARRAITCSKTADCTAAGVSIPVNSHQFCSKKVCSFRESSFFSPHFRCSAAPSRPRLTLPLVECNKNYSLVSGACVKAVASTSASSSAAPSSTVKACSKIVDCKGETIPANSHQYCRSKICSFSKLWLAES